MKFMKLFSVLAIVREYIIYHLRPLLLPSPTFFSLFLMIMVGETCPLIGTIPKCVSLPWETLAEQGVRFSNYHTVPLCGPSRRLYVHRPILNGKWYVEGARESFPLGSPGYRGIKRDVTMLSEHLSRTGYHTGCFGKWHMGSLEGEVPNDRGFDEFRRISGKGSFLLDHPKKI